MCLLSISEYRLKSLARVVDSLRYSPVILTDKFLYLTPSSPHLCNAGDAVDSIVISFHPPLCQATPVNRISVWYQRTDKDSLREMIFIIILLRNVPLSSLPGWKLTWNLSLPHEHITGRHSLFWFSLACLTVIAQSDHIFRLYQSETSDCIRHLFSERHRIAPHIFRSRDYWKLCKNVLNKKQKYYAKTLLSSIWSIGTYSYKAKWFAQKFFHRFILDSTGIPRHDFFPQRTHVFLCDMFIVSAMTASHMDSAVSLQSY